MLIATYDTTGSGLHFYLNDPLGSRRVQTDAAGFPEQTCQNLPFGNQLYCTGALDTPTEDHFTGLEHDTESGLDHAMFRQYESNAGRWTSPDPYDGSIDANNPQTLNRYAYVGNMPMNFTDPSGLMPLGCGFSTGGSDGALGITWGGIGTATGTTGTIVLAGISAASCLYSGIEDLLDLFHHPKFTASHTPRPNAHPWDEHGGFHATPNGGVGDLLGLNNAGCEFGACGNGFASGDQASGSNPFPGIISDAAWAWAMLSRSSVSWFPWSYGKWCGVGGAGNPNTPLDGACLQHDFCYFQNKVTAGDNITNPNAAGLQGCNQALCTVALQVSNSENHRGGDLDQGAAGLEVYAYFSTVRNAARCH